MKHFGDAVEILYPLRVNISTNPFQENNKIVYYNDADDCNEFEIISINKTFNS
jgi:hypothetical protein